MGPSVGERGQFKLSGYSSFLVGYGWKLPNAFSWGQDKPSVGNNFESLLMWAGYEPAPYKGQFPQNSTKLQTPPAAHSPGCWHFYLLAFTMLQPLSPANVAASNTALRQRLLSRKAKGCFSGVRGSTSPVHAEGNCIVSKAKQKLKTG